MVSTGDRMPFRFAYLTRFKLLNRRSNLSWTIPACTRGRLRRQMFPDERDHRIHGLHHFRENIIEIEMVACAPNQLLFTLHPVVEFLCLFGDQGAIRRKDQNRDSDFRSLANRVIHVSPVIHAPRNRTLANSLIFAKKQQLGAFFFDRTRARRFISPTEWPGLHGWQGR